MIHSHYVACTFHDFWMHARYTTVCIDLLDAFHLVWTTVADKILYGIQVSIESRHLFESVLNHLLCTVYIPPGGYIYMNSSWIIDYTRGGGTRVGGLLGNKGCILLKAILYTTTLNTINILRGCIVCLYIWGRGDISLALLIYRHTPLHINGTLRCSQYLALVLIRTVYGVSAWA